MKTERGFSTLFVDAVHAADDALPAVQLLRLCIRHKVPVTTVALRLRVTRATVYSWAKGDSQPSGDNLKAVMKMLDRMRQKA